MGRTCQIPQEGVQLLHTTAHGLGTTTPSCNRFRDRQQGTAGTRTARALNLWANLDEWHLPQPQVPAELLGILPAPVGRTERGFPEFFQQLLVVHAAGKPV